MNPFSIFLKPAFKQNISKFDCNAHVVGKKGGKSIPASPGNSYLLDSLNYRIRYYAQVEQVLMDQLTGDTRLLLKDTPLKIIISHESRSRFPLITDNTFKNKIVFLEGLLQQVDGYFTIELLEPKQLLLIN